MTDSADESAASFTSDELLAIERAAIHAWPANETRDVHGWLWRFSGGGSQRANSVSPLAFNGGDVDAAISEAEELYFTRNALSRFQVGHQLASPPDLDRRLEERGYRLHEPIKTLAKRIGAARIPNQVEIADRPDDGWMEVYLSNIAADRRAAAPGILASIPAPRAFLSVVAGGRVVSTALAVLCRVVVIAECIGTWAEARRTGAASLVMTALEAWGFEQGAGIAALQAVAANYPAQRLYAGLGYTKVYDHHYRVRER